MEPISPGLPVLAAVPLPALWRLLGPQEVDCARGARPERACLLSFSHSWLPLPGSLTASVSRGSRQESPVTLHVPIQ